MCKVNGPDALPVRPAGVEKLGAATHNICEQGGLYAFAHPSDYGQRCPTRNDSRQMGDPSKVKYGRNTHLDAETYHYVRVCRKAPTSKKKLNKRRKASIERYLSS